MACCVSEQNNRQTAPETNQTHTNTHTTFSLLWKPQDMFVCSCVQKIIHQVHIWCCMFSFRSNIYYVLHIEYIYRKHCTCVCVSLCQCCKSSLWCGWQYLDKDQRVPKYLTEVCVCVSVHVVCFTETTQIRIYFCNKSLYYLNIFSS